MGPVGPRSTLTDGRGLPVAPDASPGHSSVKPRPPTASLGTQPTKHLGALHLENDVLYITT